MKNIFTALCLALLSLTLSDTAKAQCTASFTYVTNADTVAFTDASTASLGSVVSWGWNFGDGGFSTTQNPSHVYNSCGIFNVSLTIFTSGFCSNTFNATVTVTGGITPSFTYTVDTTNGNVNFQAAPLGINLNYAWDLGDGSADSTVAPSHTYPTGMYYVCLTVYDNDGLCTATVCDSINVYVSPASCATMFNWNDGGSGNVGFTVTPFSFSNTFTWDFGDGNSGTGPATYNTYATAGSYYVCLTTVDSATMCSSMYCDSVVLAADPAACNFTFTYYDNNGQVGFGANPPTSSGYTWDFGDGQTGTGAATTNTYAASGTYYVCSTITDAFNGCSNTYCDSVTVTITGISEHQDQLSLNAYPNPVKDHLNVSWNQTERAEILLEIVDLVGNRIAAYNWPANPGANSMELNVSMLSKGAYLVKMSSASRSSSKLIIKN
ncbi:MAG: PKD domain-containing protein [Bacteroidia bacterium]